MQCSQLRAQAASLCPKPKPFADVLSDVRTAIAEDLRPRVTDIDSKGWYPEPFMRRMGEVGGFAQSVPVQYGGAGQGLPFTIQLMEEVARECLSTGFCVWCQTVCGWYIQNSDNTHLKETVLPPHRIG